MCRLVQAREGGTPGIALVKQGFDMAPQMLFVAGLMQAMNQPECATGRALSECTLKVSQADRAQSHPSCQH